jgi:hypothetical protein
MSDDFINQLTLNFLISKNQLQKLNKKVKENSNQIKIQEIQKYRKRITTLVNNLLEYQPPDDLLFEVKLAFDTFVDKSIYYFKAHDNSFKLENERLNKDIIHDDIDFEKEENDKEEEDDEKEDKDDEKEDKDDEEQDKDDEVQEKDNEVQEKDDDIQDKDIETQDKDLEAQEKDEEKSIYKHNNIIVKNKYTNQSRGVDDIQKLPLNWFQNVRQNYKQNHIIPRRKESTISEEAFQDVKKKI